MFSEVFRRELRVGGGWDPDDVRVAEGRVWVKVEEVDVVVVEVNVLSLTDAMSTAAYKLVVRVFGVVGGGATAGVTATATAAVTAAAADVVFVVTQVRVEGAAKRGD
ncbi:hypothetical protein PMKS-003592 [Pichia membranifaciens]|uniref:Uncharacterized protein n=1 Tax=Pichia membranifaciens TaxID=4926 RepID=A0A1Q2YKK3_9ASCO|nr:hypothetical protein PMKS-003592 [Pichia membranifaciens]